MRCHSRPRALALVVVAAFCVASVQPVLAADPERERLDQTEQEKNQKKPELEEAQRTDEQLTAALDEAGRRVTGQEAVVGAARQRVTDALARVAATEADITRTGHSIEEHEDELKRRAINAYKSADAGSLDALLSSPDLNVAVARVQTLQRVFARDRFVLEQLHVLRVDLDDLRKKLEVARVDSEGARASAEQELARLDGLKAEAEKAKAAVDARVNGLDSEYRALQEAEDHIRAAIKKRDEELSAAFAAAGIALGGPPSAAGFINPTTGVITSLFGMRWGRLHAGVDIANDIGTPIVAAARGVVIDAGWYGGYGNAVLLDHGGGLITLYGHLNAIAAAYGEVLDQGGYVGEMGSTGNSTGPHLHFEVRIDGQPVDPLPYLP